MQVHPASIIANKQLIIIASIHQPSTSTFNRFDKVYLLAKGHLCYGGLRTDVAPYFKTLGFTLPPATNPAEWILELVDTDFAFNKDSSVAQLDRIIAGCESDGTKPTSRSFFNSAQPLRTRAARRHSAYTAPIPLLHRNWIKSYRDVLPYWVRVAMYTCKSIHLPPIPKADEQASLYSWVHAGFDLERLKTTSNLV
jgi:hypothetical protein